MRHALARNVIERIFGVLKCCFHILQLPPEYDMSTQALIPPALAALHNFIREYDPEEIHLYNDDDDEPFDLEISTHPESVGELGTGIVTPDERNRANERRDKIAADMWEQYQIYLRSHAAHG